jgi:hypothetical protein
MDPTLPFKLTIVIVTLAPAWLLLLLLMYDAHKTRHKHG